MEKFELGLFEDPYVDEAQAEQICNNEKFKSRAELALRKSIVLLRNENKILPLKPKTKIYFETYYQKRGAASPIAVYKPKEIINTLEFVDSPEQADMIVLWITPGSKSLFDADGSPLYLSLSKNGVDVAHVNQLAAKKPTILAINYTNPWVIDEIYNESTKKNYAAVLATFGTKPEALIDIITGKFNPSARMPFSTPVSEEKAQNQLSDVPGYLEGKGYELFRFDEGLTYKKK
jgi:beta-glucosidase